MRRGNEPDLIVRGQRIKVVRRAIPARRDAKPPNPPTIDFEGGYARICFPLAREVAARLKQRPLAFPHDFR